MSKTIEGQQNIRVIEKILFANDFTRGYIKKIIEKINENLSSSQVDDFNFLKNQVLSWIDKTIKIKKEDGFDFQKKPKIITLVGTAGVGKTTTLAKMIAYYLFDVSKQGRKNLDVQVITTDSYHIGAYIKLKKYCDHMGVSLSSASNSSQLNKLIKEYKNNTDIIFIDTSSQSSKTGKRFVELKEMFEVLDEDLSDIYLTLSASTKTVDLRNIIENYKDLKYSNAIITKLDETETVGNIISVLNEFKVPISFLTTGENVPQDLCVVGKSLLLEKLRGIDR